MTKKERTHLTAQLKAVIEALNKSITPISGKERVYIICGQIIALQGIVGDMEGGEVSG